MCDEDAPPVAVRGAAGSFLNYGLGSGSSHGTTKVSDAAVLDETHVHTHTHTHIRHHPCLEPDPGSTSAPSNERNPSFSVVSFLCMCVFCKLYPSRSPDWSHWDSTSTEGSNTQQRRS